MTQPLVLPAFRVRSAIGLVLLLIGAPLGTLAISRGAPETLVYYLSFAIAACATIAWMSLEGTRSLRASTDHAPPLTSVLLVEKEDILRRTIAERCLARGLHVHAVASGSEALLAVQRTDLHFDVVILDITLASMRGTDLLATLQRERPDQSIVLLTATPTPGGALGDSAFTILKGSAPAPVRAQLEDVLSLHSLHRPTAA